MGLPVPSTDLSTEELFRRFAPFVARFLYRLGVDSDGLDDVVQEVFLVVHRRGGYKVGPAKPTSYLATIASNAASAYRRRRRIEHARTSDAEVEGLVSTNKGPVHVLETSERLRLLQAALDRLEPEFRTTLILADIEGESCASIAASSGVPVGTVYWRLHEARKRFQRALRAQAAGVPSRPMQPERDGAAATSSGRSSSLALALNPLWFLSDARKLLKAGAAHPPVDYDVGAGLRTHRTLASSASLPAEPAAFAPAGVVVPPSLGIGIVGVGSAGVAAIAAIAAALFVRSTPPDVPDEPAQASAAVVVPPPERAPPSPPAVQADTAAPEPANAASSDAPRATSGIDHTSSRIAAKAVHATTPATNVPDEPETAAKPSSTSPAPSAPAAVESTRSEARDIARAEHLLGSDPAGALAVVRDARSRFPRSFLAEERDYVEVMALSALGRTAEARAAANRFLAAYPGGAFTVRVRKVSGK